MKAHTLIQVDSLFGVFVATTTAALIAIHQANRCAVIASADNATIFGNYCAVATLHTVASTGSHLSQSLKVSVEFRPYKLFIIELKLSEQGVKINNVVCFVAKFATNHVLLSSSGEQAVLFRVEFDLVI